MGSECSRDWAEKKSSTTVLFCRKTRQNLDEIKVWFLCIATFFLAEQIFLSQHVPYLPSGYRLSFSDRCCFYFGQNRVLFARVHFVCFWILKENTITFIFPVSIEFSTFFSIENFLFLITKQNKENNIFRGFWGKNKTIVIIGGRPILVAGVVKNIWLSECWDQQRFTKTKISGDIFENNQKVRKLYLRRNLSIAY